MTTNPVERIIALAASALDRAAIPPPAPTPRKVEQRADTDLDAAIARHRAEQRAASHALPPCPVCSFGGYNGRCAACWHTDDTTPELQHRAASTTSHRRCGCCGGQPPNCCSAAALRYVTGARA